MKKSCLFFFVIIVLHSSHAQRKDQALLDSLLPALANAKDDTTKLKLFGDIIWVHVNYKPVEGLKYEKEALDLSEKINWERGTASLKDAIGRLHWRLGNFSAALKNHFEALAIHLHTGDKRAEAHILLAIGQDYLDDGKYDSAKTYLSKALKVSEAAGDKINMLKTYDILVYLYEIQGNITEATKISYLYLKTTEQLGDKSRMAYAATKLAGNFEKLGNYDDAIKYFKISLQLKKESSVKMEEISVTTSIGDTYTAAGNFSEALKYYSTALRLADDIKDVSMSARVHRGLGALYRAQGNYSKALDHYLVAADGYKAIGNKQQLVNLYSQMGIAYTHLTKYDQARKSLDDAMALYKDLNGKVSMVDYYNGRQLLNRATGQWKQAFKDYEKYNVIKDSAFNKETLKKLVAAQMQYEAEKKEAIQKAEQEKKDIQSREELRRRNNMLYGAFGIVAIVLLFSIVVYRQRNKIANEKKRSDQLLADKELLLREIHHRVKNNLEVVSSLLALQSAQIDDPNTKEAMQDGQNRVHSIGIVHQKLYQGENLGSIEMKDYFVNLSDSILDSFGAEGRVNVEFAMETLNVDIDTAVPLGLIVNELLTNTLKYAFPNSQKGSVRIKLEKQTGGILHLEVSDNGIGKSGVTHGTGFGGQLISLLTRQLNGSMKEEIKNGTHIFFDFKLDKVA